MSHKSVHAIAVSEGQANKIVDRLTSSWFFSSDISVLFPDKETTDEFSHENNTKAHDGDVSAATESGVDGLMGIGIPEIEAKRYENHIAEGRILISVLAESGDDVSKAKHILDQADAEDISVTPTGIAHVSPNSDQGGSFNRAAQENPLRRGLAYFFARPLALPAEF